MKVDNDPVDNLLDIVVTLQGNNAVHILKNLDDGDFGTGITIDFSGANGTPEVQNPVGLAVDDFDTNGLNDIAICGYSPDPNPNNPGDRPTLGLAWSNGDGTRRQERRQAPLTAPEASQAIDLCAFNVLQLSSGNGHRRFALTGSALDRAYFFKFDTTASPPTFVYYNVSQTGAPAQGICAADFNQDHKVDLACSVTGSANVRWIKQLSYDSWSWQDSYEAKASIRSVASGKISKKGRLPLEIDQRIDLVVGRIGSDDTRVVVMANLGSQSNLFQRFEFEVSPILTDIPHPRGVAIADLNNDGFVDVLTANAGRGVEPPGTNNDDPWEGFSVLLNRSQ